VDHSLKTELNNFKSRLKWAIKIVVKKVVSKKCEIGETSKQAFWEKLVLISWIFLSLFYSLVQMLF
jgi:NRPS condensation-like uncharacterized protein